MKLFYTEEEALREKCIHKQGKEYFYWSFSIQELVVDNNTRYLTGNESIKCTDFLYIRQEIKDTGNVVLVVYVLEQLKDEAIKIILEAYNENR